MTEEQSEALKKFVSKLASAKSDIEFAEEFDADGADASDWNTGNADDDREYGVRLATGRIGAEASGLLVNLGLA